MAFTDRITTYWGIVAIVLLSWIALAQATPDPTLLEPRQLKQTLCSSQNTASMSANLSIWQTNGLCHDFCTDKNYAFAIVQYQSCWCSNVAPASSTEADVEDKCNDICPGYDYEKCGARPNWYGYVQLAKNPTSTAGGGGGDSATTAAPSITQAPPAPPAPPATTVQVTVIETEKPQDTATSDPETTTTSTSSTSGKPRTTVQTITADGTVRTVFVTPTATGTEGATGASELTPGSQSSGNGISTGSVVGIVVGVIIAVVAFAGLFLFWFFRRRKQRRDNEKYDEPSHRGSSAGLGGSPRNPEMVVTVDGGRWNSADSTSEQRRSRLMAHDPRMEPLGRGLYVNNNKSAESINTLRDDQDYSRKVHKPVLRATNPDPE